MCAGNRMGRSTYSVRLILNYEISVVSPFQLQRDTRITAETGIKADTARERIALWPYLL